MRLGLKTVFSAAALGVAVLFSTAHADPLDPAHVPADSKWVVHLDMDAFRKTDTWKAVYDRLQHNDGFEDKLAEIEAIFGAKFPEDLHDVTLSGAVFGDKAGVVIVHASVNRKQVEQMLALNEDYASEAHNNNMILTWSDKGVINYGGFVSDTQFLIGQDKARVAAEMDTLSGKTAPMKPDANLLKGLKDGVMLYVAGDELSKLRQAQESKSPLLTQMKSAFIVLTQEKEDAVLKLNVTASDAPTAEKMRQAAEGIRAAFSLAAGEPDANAGLKTIVDLASAAVLASKDNTVTAELHVDQKKIPDLLDQAMRTKKADEVKK